jgi:hypothetical protein
MMPLWIALLWAFPGVAHAATDFKDFRAAAGLQRVGDAAISDRKILRLTPARQNRCGAAWLIEKQYVAGGFDTTFEFRLTRQGGLGPGADGLAFVLQNSGPAALGGRGSAGGFAVADANFHPRENGIPWSIAVFFDTYRNAEEDDPSANYVAIRTNGKPAEMRWPAERVAFTPNLPVRLKDRNAHHVRILFQPPVLSIYLDGSAAPVLEAVVDVSPVLDPQGRAWVGFTASTGGGYENHDILSWSFAAPEVSSNISVVSSQITFLLSSCLPNRNLCTPERAVIEPTATGYHVILPAHLEWGAEIPNRDGRAPAIRNARGIACWDLASRGASGCGAPFGNTKPAGPGFLAADAGAGNLIVKTSGGRTWFSVNGRAGSFQSNEGFYEFDLEFREH